jgi:hypothetical protein
VQYKAHQQHHLQHLSLKLEQQQRVLNLWSFMAMQLLAKHRQVQVDPVSRLMSVTQQGLKLLMPWQRQQHPLCHRCHNSSKADMQHLEQVQVLAATTQQRRPLRWPALRCPTPLQRPTPSCWRWPVLGRWPPTHHR